MRQRLRSAAVLVPVVVIVFVAGQPWLNIGIALIAALAAYEAAVLVGKAGLKAFAWFSLAMPILAVLAFELLRGDMLQGRAGVVLAAALALSLLVTALPALRERDPTEGFLAWIGTVFAGFYPSLLAFAAGVALLTATQPVAPWAGQTLESGRLWLLVLVATVWAYDSFAYVSGKYFGRGRFMYHISPAKTWSGVIGGTIAGAVACAALTTALFAIEPWWGAALGAVLGFAAQMGDLAESMLKRAAGVKDSGNLIPGHGGFLDRVDSFLFAAPTLYAVLVLTGLGHAGGVP